MSIEVFAPAKINLTLRVGPPGPDGRHPLNSLVGFTKTCGDIVRVERSDDLSLTISGPFAAGLSDQNDNLVMRAAHLLRDQLGINTGAAITLTKRLPIASGIGGGSADAAAALTGLNQLWGNQLSGKELQVLGAQLGADVPACVLGKALAMTGTGETIEAVGALPALGIVLVNPLITCPTGPVYQQYDRTGAFAQTRSVPFPRLQTVELLVEYLTTTPNDLQNPAIELVPQIGEVLAAIGATARVLLSRMSGSGATCFGLYANLEDARAAACDIQKTLASTPIWVEADEIN